jgi:cyclase
MKSDKGIKSPFKKDGLFNEAGHIIFEHAKSLRKNMTDAENAVWGYIKGGIEGCKFRRQHPLGIFIVTK